MDAKIASLNMGVSIAGRTRKTVMTTCFGSQIADILHMTKFDLLSNCLKENGYVYFNERKIVEEVFESVTEISLSNMIIDSLEPKKENTENPGAWSNIYSDKEFPPHTDFAYQALPPRFIGLHCISHKNSDRPTFILDSQKIPSNVKNKLHKVIWRIRHHERSGTVRMFDKKTLKGCEILRYDPVCMAPYFKKDIWAIDLLNHTYRKYSDAVAWEENGFMIIDNWRCFHGRGLNKHFCKNNEKRVFQRYSAYI